MLELVVAGAFLVAASAIAALDTAPARAVSYSLARRRRQRRQPERDVRRRTGGRQLLSADQGQPSLKRHRIENGEDTEERACGVAPPDSSGSVATLSALVLSYQAWAQAPAPRAPGAGGGASLIAVVLIILAVLVILGIRELYDLQRRRESEAVQLQAQISDALVRDQLLYSVPIMATARAPFWRRSPATIEIAGQVPSPQARETVLRIVRAEASRIQPDVQIEDRIAVVPPRAA